MTFTIKQQTGQAIWEISAPVNQPSDIQQIAQALVKGLALIGTAVQPPEVSELIVTSQSTYTRAWYFFDQRTEASLTKAIELFDMVLNQYPQHIPSLMGKASAFSDLTRFEKKKKEESVNYQMSRLLFQQAKGIAPAHPRVIGSEYSFDFSKGDWAFHEQKLKHLIADDPTCRDCILSLVRFYWIVGWYQESERLLERQLEYFPLSVQLHSMLARTYARTGKVDAIETQNELIMLFGSHSTHDAHTAQANAAYARGDGQTWLSVQRQFIPAESPVAQIVMPFLEAIVADDIAEMKRLSEFFPDGAFFNFRLNVGQIEPLIERIEQGIAANDYFDFAQIHGFRTPRNELTKHYVDRLIEFQNNSRVSDIFIEQGLLAFWQQTQKWPDYCYLETRPIYCEGANSL